MTDYLGEPKRPDQPLGDMAEPSVAKPITLDDLKAGIAQIEALEHAGHNLPPPSSSPPQRKRRETSDWRKQRDAAKANGQGMGSSSSPPFQHQTKKSAAQSDESAEDEQEGGKRVHPTHERRGIPQEVKHRLVQSFACFQSLTTIKDWLASDYGLKLDDRTIQAYDCGRLGSKVGKRLRSLYDETRKAYVQTSANMAVAHQAHRLKMIGEIVEKATKSKDYNAALKGLELAAKETGGQLENRQVIEHKGIVSHVHGSVEDARAEVAMRLAAMVDAGTLSLPAVALPASVDDVATTEGDAGGG